MQTVKTTNFVADIDCKFNLTELKSVSSKAKDVIHWESASQEVVDKELQNIAEKYKIERVSPKFDMVQFMKNKIIDSELEDPFYVIDIGVLKRKIQQWRTLLPRVEPFYALKCNPHPVLLRTLRALGVGFDCASKNEIQTVLNGLQICSSKIIFANPCKPVNHLLYAKQNGVDLMTFDNKQELIKIKKHHPSARLVLRILTDDSSSICRFGSKFGAPPGHIPTLLSTCKELGLNLVGVSFHVGSGCLSAEAYVDAVRRAHAVFRKAEELQLPPLSILDIGGGFPGASDPFPHPSFKDIARALRAVLDQLFPPRQGVRIIAEPGRYFAAETHTLAVCVFARRDVELEELQLQLQEEEEKLNKEMIINEVIVNNNNNNNNNNNSNKEEEDAAFQNEDESVEKPDFLYYVNDGVYGSFNCLIFDHAIVVPLPLKMIHSDSVDSGQKKETGNNTTTKSSGVDSLFIGKEDAEQQQQYRCKIFGPTCDSLDCISKNSVLPKLEIGDWMYFKEMGAYTVAAGSEFNGFLRPEMYFVDSALT